MNDYLSLFFGVLCAAIGGELFVRGTVGLAHWARISPGIIGATVAAFATSSPEFSVSINASLAGTPQIALGDALGSNVGNVALILGLALVISGIQCPRASIRRDFPVSIFVPLITGALILDGELSRFDGIVMLLLFTTWLTLTILEAKQQRSVAEAILGEHKGWRSLLYFIAGLIILISAGTLIVNGAKGIAHAHGIDPFVIGATLVAVGTSAPELATVLIAKLRGHDEVGLGTILGSNIMNGLCIVATAAVIWPIRIRWQEVYFTLLWGLITLLCCYPSRRGYIDRQRGGWLLVLYTIYVSWVMQQNPGE